MKIQEELQADRLAIDYDTPHVLIRYDLYLDMLDASMFPYAWILKNMKWYERMLLRLTLAFEAIRGRRKEEVFSYLEALTSLKNIREFINEHRKSLDELPMRYTQPLNFTVVKLSSKPIYVGYQLGDDWHIKPHKQQNSQT